jgi:hypothetical protein
MHKLTKSVSPEILVIAETSIQKPAMIPMNIHPATTAGS